ncbi:MAG TPA: tetratricopeptide repeat protein [Acidobacteriota bacterium]|nr:tetratricopeptide repeat protein [Acidobacteriota bacterium]
MLERMTYWGLARTAAVIVLLMAGAPLAGQDREEEPEVQARSLLGKELRTPPVSSEVRAEFEAKLEEARKRYRENPSEENLIWVGRRLAYLGRYRQAVKTYTQGLEEHEASPHLLRHRGHRFITLRRFDWAIDDFEKAAGLTQGQPDEVEEDGLPNARNVPTSTLQTNIYYHLGLAHYLKGDFEKALDAYQECLQRSRNNDMQVATRHWLYMTLRRLGRQEEAREVLMPVEEGMDIIENQAYYDLLLMYKGLKTPQDLLDPEADGLQSATVGYGIGNWHLYNGRREEAMKIFGQIVEQPGWAAFGYIASEAELARRGD